MTLGSNLGQAVSTRNRYAKRIGQTALGLGLLLVVAASPVRATDLPQTINERLASLASSTSARVTTIGTTRQGRAIEAVVLTNPAAASDLEDRTRVVILAGQHGNEPTPVHAILRFLGRVTSRQECRAYCDLDRLIVAFVPVVNPDGLAARKRCNSAGADLNRDWVDVSQPETLAVARLVHEFRPQVLIDLHEWSRDDPHSPNCIEIARSGTGAGYRLSHLLTREYVSGEKSGFKLRPVYYHPSSDPRLAHRRFAGDGICTFLIETEPAAPTSVRVNAYDDFIISVLSDLASTDSSEITETLANVRPSAWDAAQMARLLPLEEPQKAGKHPEIAFYWMILAIGSIYLAAGSSRPKRLPGTTEPCRRMRTISIIAASDMPTHTRRAFLASQQGPTIRTRRFTSSAAE